jgi:integrase
VAKILTQRAVEAAKPPSKDRDTRPDGIVPGQQFIVHPGGKKSYRLLARVNGKQVNFPIGDATVLTLAEARTKGKRILAEIADGKDPREARRAAVKAGSETVEVLARRFIERYAKVHNKRWKDVEQRIGREILPRWRNRPITSITQSDVVALLDAIMDRDAPRAANLTLATVRKMFNWACERGMLETSPCDRVKAPAPEVKRDRVPTDAELALIWQAAGELGYPFGPFFQLLVTTGQRREQVAGARWSEFDSKLTVWVVPGKRTKNGVEHKIPVAAATRAILAGLPRFAGCDLVFSTNGKTSISGFSKAKAKLDRAVAGLNGDVPIESWTPHDLRRACASTLAALGVQLPVVEKILHHLSGVFGGVSGVYQRHSFFNEMAEALERWGQHVGALTKRAPKPRPSKIAGRSARPEKGRRQEQSGLGVRP